MAEAQEVKDKIAKLAKLAHDGNAEWMHKILTKSGYIKKGERATKEDIKRYGKAMGEVFETLITHVAQTAPELAEELRTMAHDEVTNLQW